MAPRREALPRLQGRPRQGQGPGAAPRPPRRERGDGARRRGAPTDTAGRAPSARPRQDALGAPDRPRLAGAARARDRLGGRQLLRVLERRLRREQAARPEREAALSAPERPAALPPDDDPRARHRQRRDRRPRGRQALRLDHARCAPTRRTTGSYYLSIPRDLTSPIPGVGTQKINAAFQIGGPALAIRTIRIHRARHQPRDRRQLRRLQGSDRRARRDRRRRAEADPLEPLRLPVLDAGALRQWQGWRFRRARST